MTTPNQPAPTWMQLLGLGAFQIGGSGGGSGQGSYGQGLSESFVNDLIYGPLAPSNLAANSGAVSDLIPVMQAMIAGVPITVLRYLQPFIPGATDANFADSPTAAAFIVSTFVPKMIIDTTNWVGRFVKDTAILFDVFHTTYPAGSPTDPAGQTSWYAAWNDLLELIGLYSGTTPTTPAPTIGPAITVAGIAGANGSTWATRLTNDLIITSDVFHLTYNAGTPTDAPGHIYTGGGIGNGKVTWYAAWNDLLALCGVVNSVTAPTDPAPAVASAITTAQSGATTANANASSALSQLTAIPAQTIVPSLDSGASSVTFGNAGSGGSATNSSGSVSTPLACTGTQTIGASASIMVATVTFSLVGPGGVSGNATVAIGGQQMQNLGVVQLPSVTEYVETFILWNPPVGIGQTVTATGYANSGGVASISFESASYIGVTTVSAPITNSGTGTALTLSVPAAVAGTMAVAAFSAGDVLTKATTALSAYTKTSRGNTTVQVNSTQYGYQSLVLGDSVGGSGGVTFGATGANSSAEWLGVGIILSATSVIGSGFRTANTSTTPVTALSGNNILAGGFFNSTPIITSDYSYNSTTNTLTVANAGWYSVTIALLVSTSYTSFMLGPVLYQNGALSQSGMRQYISSGQPWVLQSTFSIYCNAGDTLQPGSYSGVTFSTTFVGESTGTSSYWEVALMNRSLL